MKMSDKTEITPEALAALALARHVREIAVESGADADSDERIGPDVLHQWQEWYACALTWATAPSDEGDGLERTVYAIAKNIAGKRWGSAP